MIAYAAPSRVLRLAVALTIGTAWGSYAFTYLTRAQWQAGDFTQIWLAARAVLEGREAYAAVLEWERAGQYLNQLGLYYPLPAALLGLPFVGLRAEVAGAAFVAVTFALGAYVVTRERWIPLFAFVGPAAFHTARSAQLGGLLLAAMFLPRAWGWVTVLKPTVGLAAWLWRPSRTAAVLGATVLAAGLLVDPAWPLRWLKTVHGSQYAIVPFAQAWFAPLLLLAALRWRTRGGRLLLAVSCVPHTMFWYDEMVLGAIPRTWREGLYPTIVAWAVYVAFRVTEHRAHPNVVYSWDGIPWSIAALYIPALVLVLRHPNVGRIPAPIERTFVRLSVPRWLVGQSAALDPTSASTRRA